MNARQVANMSSECQGGGESGRFNPYEINKQRIFMVYGDDEVTLPTVSGHDAGPDSGIGPAKIAFIQGRKEFLQALDKHPRWRLSRRIVRFVSDHHLIRSHEQLSVWSRTEMNALTCRAGRQGGIHQAPNEASFLRGDKFVVLTT